MKKKKSASVKAKKKLKSKPARKKVVKKVAKKTTKVKVQKKKKSTPVSAKKKIVKKVVAKKAAKEISKVKTATKKKPLLGYPHYPAKDDIMNPSNKAKKVSLNENSNGLISKKKNKVSDELEEKPYLSDIKNKKTRNSGKLTKEDQDLFDSEELNPDMGGDDAVLKNRVWPVDMSGDDLDIPGAELDDASEILGDEDEENNNYSIGGDRHDDLEENSDLGI